MSEGFTGAHNGVYYKNGVPVCAVSQMDNLPQFQRDRITMPPLEPKSASPAPKQGKKVVRRKKKTRAKKSAKTEQAQPKKPIPASSAQPRDNLGRFASFAGRAIVATAKGAARATRGAVKTANKAHKVINNQRKQAKRRQNLELRERTVAVREREQALGGSKKKIVRRK